MKARTLLVAMVALAGCGGGEDDRAEPPAPERAEASVVRDPALGYELRLPDGWVVPDDLEPGQSVPIGGEGRGCVIGTAGTLGDVGSQAKLVAFAREFALARAPGAQVVVEPVRGANIDGATVRISRAGREGRSAIFVTAGGGVALTCAGRSADATRFDRGLPALYASVRLRRDRELEAVQPKLATVPGVQGASLRRLRDRVGVRLELEDFGAAKRVLTAALGVAAGELDEPVGISAGDPEDPQRVAAGQAQAGARSGTVQVVPGPPEKVSLR